MLASRRFRLNSQTRVTASKTTAAPVEKAQNIVCIPSSISQRFAPAAPLDAELIARTICTLPPTRIYGRR